MISAGGILDFDTFRIKTMPFRVKLAVSILVVLVAAAGFWYQELLGQIGPKYAVAILACLMLIAMWLFPEVKRTEPRKEGP
jgi:hypothetical protein